VRDAKRDLVGPSLVESNPGGDAEQVGQAQDAGRLRAGVIDDANFVRGASRHRFVAPGQDFDPSGS
jgi:hypothetical protein